MTKNDAYKYFMSIRRKHLSHLQLEQKMQSEGYTEEDVKLVKAWIGNDYTYLSKFK